MGLNVKIYTVSFDGFHQKAFELASALVAKGLDVTIVYSDPNPRLVFSKRIPAIRVPHDLSWAAEFLACIDSCKADLMLVINADCECADYFSLVKNCVSAFNQYPDLSIWSANIAGTYNELKYTQIASLQSDGLVSVAAVDFFVFAIDQLAIRRLKTVDFTGNPNGWGAGVIAGSWAHKNNRLVCVDRSQVVRCKSDLSQMKNWYATNNGEFFKRSLDRVEGIFFRWAVALSGARKRSLSPIDRPRRETALRLSRAEQAKHPKRFDILNSILSSMECTETRYLEIGVRNPNDNFNRINANFKFSVDPGLEYPDNPVDFNGTSDEFFSELNSGRRFFEGDDPLFDVIFIDGLHLADQVYRDVLNSLSWLKADGFIVLHDCNPPTEYHARETYSDVETPAGGSWNGTVWKALVVLRRRIDLSVFCIDTDWGCGVISKDNSLYPSLASSDTPFFYEYDNLSRNRVDLLGLIRYEEFKKMLSKRGRR